MKRPNPTDRPTDTCDTCDGHNGLSTYYVHFTPTFHVVVPSLKDQRSRMQGVRNLVLGMASSVGVSNATMRVIEKREVMDKILVGICMAFITALLYFLYF